MAALQKFKDQGWHLSEDAVKRLSDDGQITDFRELLKKALDTDLRDISLGGPLGTEFFKPGKLEFANAAVGIVLQVQAVRNVSAPTSNEESKTAPRMLQVDFTDGQHKCPGLEMEAISSLSVNTAPGSKVLLRGTVKVAQGYLMLVPANVQVLGGQVQVLFERWEHNRALAKYAKGIRPAAGPNGPPPWIQFGQRSAQQQQLSKEKGFKSLAGVGEKDGEVAKENAEFAAMRAQAISEALRVKTKKTFGGGGRNMVDYNVKKICDKGFTEEEAKLALKYARNNLERAMGSLKKDRALQSGTPVEAGRSNGHTGGEETHMGGRGGGRGGRGDRRGGRGDMDADDGSKPPAKPVSLFDFLTEKIPQVVPDTQPFAPHSFASSSSAATSARPTYPSSNRQSSSSHNNNHHQQHSASYSNHRDEHNHYPSSKNKHEDNPFRKPTQSHAGGAKPTQSQRVAEKATPRSQSHGHIERPPKNETARSTTINANSTASASSKTAATVSSKNPFSLENRAKFQNNVSTSFANRKTTPGVAVPATQPTAQPPSVVAVPSNPPSDVSRNNRAPAQSRKPAAAGTAVAVDQRGGNRKATTTPPDSTSSYNAAAKYQQNAPKFNKGGLLATGPGQKPQPQPQAVVDTTASASTTARNNNNPFSKGSNNDRRATTAPLAVNTNSNKQPTHSAQVAELTKATAAIKIDSHSKSARSSGHKSNAAANAAPTSSAALAANKAGASTNHNSLNDVLLPNGFNPNKIMGFANKETNEVALNVLRANALSTQGPVAAGAPVAVAAPATVPGPFAPVAPLATNNRRGGGPKQQNQSLSQKPQPKPHAPKQQQQQQQQHQQAPPPQQQQQAPHVVVQHQPSYVQHHYSIIQQPPPPSPQTQQPQPLHMFGFQPFNRPLNVKDVCFAKYWEDGGFYNAEITGVCESTCVVEFLEYGNFEEVLLSDCVPITEMNIQLVNQYNASLPMNVMQSDPLATAHLYASTNPTPPPQQQQQPAVPIQHVALAAQQQQQYYVNANAGHQQQQQPLLQTPVHQHQQPQHFNPTAMHYGGGAPQQHQQQQQSFSQQQQQRLRGERQMYVPPAQRSTK